MYTKEEHFLVKLLTNNAMQLEETVETLRKEVKFLLESNNELYRNYNILKDKYDNAVAMLHNEEPVKQEIVTQPRLFEDSFYAKGIAGESSTLDKTEKSNDLTPHFKMQPTRRRLTTEQAQHAYNMVAMGNARITDMAKKFNCHEGTIHNVMSGTSYKEIDRTKQ